VDCLIFHHNLQVKWQEWLPNDEVARRYRLKELQGKTMVLSCTKEVGVEWCAVVGEGNESVGKRKGGRSRKL